MERSRDEWAETHYPDEQTGQFVLFALESQILQAIRDRQQPETD